MIKSFIFYKYILIIGFLISSFAVFSQCNTQIYHIRDTISCGESTFLQQVGVGGVSGDDFSSGTLSGLWQNVTTGWTLTSPCGIGPGGQHLWFASGSATPRQATTIPVDASCGGDICFDFKMETQSPPPCDGPVGDGLMIALVQIVGCGEWTPEHVDDLPTADNCPEFYWIDIDGNWEIGSFWDTTCPGGYYTGTAGPYMIEGQCCVPDTSDSPCAGKCIGEECCIPE